MPDFGIDKRERSCTITLGASLIAAGVPELREALKNTLDVEEIVFDFGTTTMIDSSGIGLLIATANSLARTNGRVRVIGASGDIYHLLESMRLVARLNVSGKGG